MGDGHDMPGLEERLGYQFSDRAVLERAVTHRSFANEGTGIADNERLEFLGDAVVGLTVGADLMERFPELDEGQLSATRAEIVSEPGLAMAARRLGLGAWLRLGRGEQASGGGDKPSLLCDALEAVVGAVYQDGGFAQARAVVLRLLAQELQAVDPASTRRDFKTRFQEAAQALLGSTPLYELVEAIGPDHAKLFTVRVLVDAREFGAGEGRSKKAAEQRAAEAGLAALNDVT